MSRFVLLCVCAVALPIVVMIIIVRTLWEVVCTGWEIGDEFIVWMTKVSEDNK